MQWVEILVSRAAAQIVEPTAKETAAAIVAGG